MNDARPVERITSYSSRAEAWRDALGFLLWLIGTALLLIYSSRLSVPLLLVCGAAWIGVLALVARKSWLLFLGPVFFYDVVRLGRRKWVFWVRCLFAAFLGAILMLMYRSYFEYRTQYAGPARIADLARFAEEFFYTFVSIQLAVVFLLTPATIAPAISEEKEKRTLEFLFATDLRNREIVFGKLIARLGTIGLFLLAGLPILTLTQFFGGVDPNQVICYTLGTVIFVLFLAAVSIWCSVSIKKSRDAIALAFLVPIAYHALSAILYGFGRQAQAMMPPNYWLNQPLLGSDSTLADLFMLLARGNLFVLLAELSDAVRLGALYEVEIWRFLGQYAAFHLIAVLFFLTVAVLRLRPMGLKHASGGEVKSKGRKARRHPEVGDRPMVWKEVYVESSFRAGWLGKIVLILIAILTFAPAGIIAYDIFAPGNSTWYLRADHNQWDELAERMNSYVRTVSTIVACLLLVGAAVRGAGSVRGERDKQTFDSLMTTPLSVREILWGKWWGCVVGNRFGLYWLGAIWLIGLATGGLHPIMVPFLIGAILLFLSGFAWIGLWCSISFSTTLRATVWALASAFFFGGGYLVIMAMGCICLNARGSGTEEIMKLILGLCPATTLSYLPMSDFSPEQVGYINGSRRDSFAVYCFIGCCAWALFSFVVGNLAVEKFRRDNNRTPFRDERTFGPDAPLRPLRETRTDSEEGLRDER